MASKKKQGGIRKRDGIHFVNARPASETERLRAHRLVRAHVGRWISDQTKGSKDRADAEAATTTSTVEAKQPTSSTGARARKSSSTSGDCSGSDAGVGPSSWTLVSRPSPQTRYVTVGPHRHPHALNARPSEWQSVAFPPSQASDSSDSSDDAQTPSLSKQPVAFVPWYEVSRIEPQISGYFNPFGTYPTSFPPDVVDMSETYLSTVIWPGLVPRSGRLKKAGESWLPLSLSDPALFTAFMYGSLCHQRVQWLNQKIPSSKFGAKEQRVLQLCEMEAIKLINQAMNDPSRRVSDAVLLSVICMAHHQAGDDTFKRCLPTPFRAPLQNLQWLSVYGCLPPNMIHIQGLVQLIIMRGGLQNIKTNGLAATISFSALFTASVLCVKPGFEFWPVDESRYGITLQALLGFSHSDVTRGFGRLLTIGVIPEMAEAFTAVRTYINIVKIGLERGYDVSLITDQRNLTQHTLFSLLPAPELSHLFTDLTQATTYEACRLASWIFAVGVIFPIPAQSTPLGRLAKELQGVLRAPTASSLWSSPHSRIPLIWILMLGGIAATAMPERPWFVSVLGKTLQRSGISSWIGMRRVLDMMLWYDLACDESAEALYRDASILPESYTA
ncbi:Protein of unknown function DUF3468 [Penicillium argentinense]|uniref:Tachykinin family protein n=1 Tax=Penicillium argentinense TaxID=1131581 RepID=A0A9W9G039_9EURO|nr:Protein of unknown function DUF3468 [Penicillium argentinense]KAJ5109661.1 Protein of unknown function DUF3468 [Penicillium argentinense]